MFTAVARATDGSPRPAQLIRCRAVPGARRRRPPRRRASRAVRRHDARGRGTIRRSVACAHAWTSSATGRSESPPIRSVATPDDPSATERPASGRKELT
jgi:hypothetical protein